MNVFRFPKGQLPKEGARLLNNRTSEFFDVVVDSQNRLVAKSQCDGSVHLLTDDVSIQPCSVIQREEM